MVSRLNVGLNDDKAISELYCDECPWILYHPTYNFKFYRLEWL